LNIRIENTRIITSTYQKPLNLYLYIPPSSAHPPSCFKGLIHGEICRYWLQNTAQNYENLATNFIKRLLDRGHTLEMIKPLLLQAAAALDSDVYTTRSKSESNTLFFHLPYHPKGIQRQTVRRLFNSILQPHVPFENMQVAISRPKT